MYAVLLPIAFCFVAAGAAALAYQRSGKRPFETAVSLAGIALLACGIAIARDVSIGSTSVLWVLTPHTPILAAAH